MGTRGAGASTRRTVVVGGGMSGLRVARELNRHGRDVVLVEAAPSVGGLASAWRVPIDDAGPDDEVAWDRFYHVVLESDARVRALLEELGVDVHFRTVRSEMLAGGDVLPMSSVLDLLRLRSLRPLDRVRVGATVGIGGLLPLTERTDRTTSARWLRRVSGRRAYHDLWAPLLRAKLGSRADEASAVFIRSTFRRLLSARLRGGDGDRFGWVDGGYARVLGLLVERLEQEGVEVRTSAATRGLERDADRWRVLLADDEVLEADEVVLTLSAPHVASLVEGADGLTTPPTWAGLGAIPYVGCVCVFVVTRRPITGGYLTYVTDETPYTAVVEMSQLVDPDRFGGRGVLYLPRYCPPDDPLFDRDPDAVAREFTDDLVRRHPGLEADDVVATRTARARLVLPVPVPGARRSPAPPDSGIPGLFLAGSAQITDGTLNVESTLQVADAAVDAVLTASRQSRPPTPAQQETT